MTPKERILFTIQKAIPIRINSKIGISNQSIMRDKNDTPTTIPKTKRKNRKLCRVVFQPKRIASIFENFDSAIL